jgi:hypothetical protein
MAHCLSGIITSFKYTGELPAVILVGNYCFIPLSKRRGPNYSEEEIPPYEELTSEGKKLLKELSFGGKCCYIETDYFGGAGTQMAETWQDGQRISGPIISVDGYASNLSYPETRLVEHAINQNLALIGIYRHENKDEFDTARLGWFRSNKEVLEEYFQSDPE